MGLLEEKGLSEINTRDENCQNVFRKILMMLPRQMMKPFFFPNFHVSITKDYLSVS